MCIRDSSGSGSAALEDRAGVRDSSGNDQLVDVHAVVILSIGDRTLEELEHRLGSSLGRLHQIDAGSLGILAADDVAQDRDLARGNTQVFQMSFRFHVFSSLDVYKRQAMCSHRSA